MGLSVPAWAARAAGLGPVPAPPHAFGLVGGDVLYSRWEARQGSPPELAELHREPLPPGALGPGPSPVAPTDPSALRAAVAALVGRAGGPMEEASLVLSDEVLRLTFVELGDLPRQRAAREDVIRWKLRKTLPVRVESLRMATVEVPPMPAQSEGHRLLVAYGDEELLAALEGAWEAAGVRLGRITNRSLALLAGLPGASRTGLVALAVVRPSHYTLLFARDGVPVLYRFKALDGRITAGPGSTSIERDLKLTRGFLGEHLPGEELSRIVTVAQRDVVEGWQAALERGLGAPATAHDGRVAAVPGEQATELLALAGAAQQEIE